MYSHMHAYLADGFFDRELIQAGLWRGLRCVMAT
jgi:hypothetical protein